VRNSVSEILGREPNGKIDPMTAVGEGAAIAAAILTGELETSDYFVSTEHAMGTVVVNGGARPALKFDDIIARNHKIPAREAKIYFPVVDHQKTLHVVVMEGDVSKPLEDEDNVVIWEGTVTIPEPRAMGEISLEFQYEYDVDGILWITLRDVERDAVIPPFDRMPITSGVTKDRKALVRLAGHVSQTMESGTRASSNEILPSVVEDREARELVDKARTKVIPYLDDSQAQALQRLVEAVESAANGQLDGAKRELEGELRKYSYLL
jgi:molecular chaperone DnaK (HSP70)